MPTPSEMESTVANIQKTNLVAQFQLKVEPAKMTHIGNVTNSNVKPISGEPCPLIPYCIKEWGVRPRDGGLCLTG